MVSLRGASQISQPSTVFKPNITSRLRDQSESAHASKEPSKTVTLPGISWNRFRLLEVLRDPKLAAQGMSWNEKKQL